MFKSFSNLKIGLKIVFGILFVELISLASGVTIGLYKGSTLIVLGCIFTIVISQIIAWLVAKDIDESVKKVLSHLSETSKDLNSISSELTQTGHKLAEGSSEQAASIQETSSTLEESSSMVHQTTQNTKEAEVLAKQTKEAADKGNSEMQVMLDSMKELKTSSDEISKIIKVIDEIAFQTNILSLNAAVEAARAGDAGKGFAVVAEEVRNLAQRSAQAAKDTTVIIESNISLSEKCLKITEQVDSSLVEIMTDSHKVSELLEEISTASQEQEIGIVQINQAISQMERVLQANATTAQESAKSSDALSSFSDTIKAIMKELGNLIEGNKNSEKRVSIIPQALKTKPEKLMRPNLGSKTNKPVAQSAKFAPVKEKTPTKVEKTQPKQIEKKPQPTPQKAPIAKKIDTAKAVRPEDIIPLDDF